MQARIAYDATSYISDSIHEVLDTLLETLGDLKRFEGPTLLHVVTTKGKGYGPAELDKTTFHGVGVFDPETGEASKGARKTYTSVYAETAVEVASESM